MYMHVCANACASFCTGKGCPADYTVRRTPSTALTHCAGPGTALNHPPPNLNIQTGVKVKSTASTSRRPGKLADTTPRHAAKWRPKPRHGNLQPQWLRRHGPPRRVKARRRSTLPEQSFHQLCATAARPHVETISASRYNECPCPGHLAVEPNAKQGDNASPAH